MNDALLLFLSRGEGFDGWIRLAGGEVAARGEGLPDGDWRGGVPVVAIAPGEAVTLRWIELPVGLAPAQAAAAARLMAAELSAEPPASLHVAVGREDGPLRCVGLVPAETMADWLARVEGAGWEAERLLPETLLMEAPEDGFLRYDTGLVCLHRSRDEAFAAEADLGALLLAGRGVEDITAAGFESGLAAALAAAPLDLRQGPFARRRALVDGGRVRRLALLVAALLVATLALQVAEIARHSFAADAADAEARRLAAAALPRSAGVGDPAQALTDRLAELRGPGAGFSASAAALFAAVRDTPGVELAGLDFTPEGEIAATAQADTPASMEALRQRIEAGGFAASMGPPRAGGGRQLAQLSVRPR